MITAPHDFAISNTTLPPWATFKPANGGWLYIIRSGSLLKVGKTTNPIRRLQQAQTWLPNGEVVGVKPFWFIDQLERELLIGLANCWHGGEWHEAPDEAWSEYLATSFSDFDDHDRNKNTIDFSYWIGSSGMAELFAERANRQLSLRGFQREISA